MEHLLADLITLVVVRIFGYNRSGSGWRWAGLYGRLCPGNKAIPGLLMMMLDVFAVDLVERPPIVVGRRLREAYTYMPCAILFDGVLDIRLDILGKT